MSYGCAICTEVFSSHDALDQHIVAVKSCGHTFHSSCLKTWLARSRTCPTCRAVTMDSPIYLFRIHLNHVNNLNLSSFCDTSNDTGSKDAMEAKDREIKDLRHQVNSYRVALRSIRSYTTNAQTCFAHIDVELGAFVFDETIDLSSPPVSSPVFVMPAPPATTSTVVSSRTSTASARLSSAQIRIRSSDISSAARAPPSVQSVVASASRGRSRSELRNF